MFEYSSRSSMENLCLDQLSMWLIDREIILEMLYQMQPFRQSKVQVDEKKKSESIRECGNSAQISLPIQNIKLRYDTLDRYRRRRHIKDSTDTYASNNILLPDSALLKIVYLADSILLRDIDTKSINIRSLFFAYHGGEFLQLC